MNRSYSCRRSLSGSGKPYASNEELDTALAGEGVDHNGFHYYKTRLFYYRESYVSLQSFSSIEVRMQDAKDPANCVTVTYKNEGTQFLSNVCGAEQVASINANNEFSFCYDGETNMVTDINSNKLGAITRTDAGKSFSGFQRRRVCDDHGAGDHGRMLHAFQADRQPCVQRQFGRLHRPGAVAQRRSRRKVFHRLGGHDPHGLRL